MIINFEDLPTSDLFKNAMYQTDGSNSLHGDVVSKVMQVGNQGGFRKKNIRRKKKLAYMVLESTGKHPEWKDMTIDDHALVIYYGDHDNSSTNILDTKQGGNNFLTQCFYLLKQNYRAEIVPIFYFVSAGGRNREFVGLLVPGNKYIIDQEQLRTIFDEDGQAINLQAHFTVLPVKHISRIWIDDLVKGLGIQSAYAPKEWLKWIAG